MTNSGNPINSPRDTTAQPALATDTLIRNQMGEPKVTFKGFLDLPRELRDRIYDQATSGAIYRGGTETDTKVYFKDGQARTIVKRGVQAFLFTSLQIFSEIVPVLDRKAVPHKIRIRLDNAWNADYFTITPETTLGSSLPTAARGAVISVSAEHARQLYINPYHYEYASKFAASNAVLGFGNLLGQCQNLTSLSVQWHERAIGYHSDYGSMNYHPTKAVQREVVQGLSSMIEKLPALLHYSVTFDWQSIYACRPSASVAWESTEVTRFSQHRRDYSWPDYEWRTRFDVWQAKVKEQGDRGLDGVPGGHACA